MPKKIIVLLILLLGFLVYALVQAQIPEQTGILAPRFEVDNCSDGQAAVYRSSTKDFGCSEVIPTDFITMRITGTCPSGYSEVPELDGYIVLGTLSEHGNIGTTLERQIGTGTTTLKARRVIFCSKD